jgi:hypothetical protein
MELHPKRRTAAWVGGLVACVLLILAGIAYVVIGIDGRNTVEDNVSREQIVGSPDMTPELIVKGATEAGLTADQYQVPDCSIADQPVRNGADAQCFADYMRVHALESSGGLTYAQMGRFQLASDPSDPAGTSDDALAAKDATGKPIPNGPRNTWVTETALATGLQVANFAEQVALFAIVVGILMMVIGIGMGVLTVVVFGWTPWKTGQGPPAPAT